MEENLKKSGVGERIKQVRGSESLPSFAKGLGVHKHTLSRYEKEESSPDANFVRRLCEKYNINPNWLLMGEEPKERLLQPKRIMWEPEISESSSSLESRLSKSSRIEGELKRMKDALGITSDEELAKALNIPEKSIIKLRERNEYVPTSWNFKVGKLTECSYDWLAFGSGPKIRCEYEKKLHNKALDEEEMISSLDLLPLDSELLEYIITSVEQLLDRNNLFLSPRKKSIVISILYETSIYNKKYERKLLDYKEIERFLRYVLKDEKTKINYFLKP